MNAPAAAPLVLIAAGGTGGHLFPAEALAGALTARGVTVDLVTDKRVAVFARSFPARDVHVLPSDTLRGRNPLAVARTAAKLAWGTLRAIALLLRLRPAAVVGFGGYPTFPPVVAAWFVRVPRIIHDQNAVIGRANRMLAGCATLIATGYPNVLADKPRLAVKAVHVGNPVREAVRTAAAQPYRAPGAAGPIRFVVFGGSQGARIMSEVVPAAIESLPQALLARIEVVQQCRPEDVEDVQAVYRRIGLKAEIAAFFPDLPARMAQSHLVISRSGASTVAELAVIGRPALLVPLPHAIDQDQLANAMALVAAGGAMLIRQSDLTAARLSEELAALLGDPGRLASMAAAARGLGRADAAERLAGEVLRVAGLFQMRQNSAA